MVPLAGIEPALLAELDFESSASTNSATGAQASTGLNGSALHAESAPRQHAGVETRRLEPERKHRSHESVWRVRCRGRRVGIVRNRDSF